ncbi:hypothetical protein PR048_018300 [Dryococelus australis]|uniref:Uncharacterized protein n=1 Tax=Dryococelus australis TaxID=614101 RepID=A0ABQ9HC46_9NEOP|nr:hypothetical protein PR048_018300 [Dryococelus australis]
MILISKTEVIATTEKSFSPKNLVAGGPHRAHIPHCHKRNTPVELPLTKASCNCFLPVNEKKMSDLRKFQPCLPDEEDFQAKEGPENAHIITIDLQHTMLTQKMTRGPAFYLRNNWTYNVGIHDCSMDAEHMLMGGGGGSDKIACFEKYIRNMDIKVEKMVIFSDNFGDQNKNYNIVGLYNYLISTATFIYPISHPISGVTHALRSLPPLPSNHTPIFRSFPVAAGFASPSTKCSNNSRCACGQPQAGCVMKMRCSGGGQCLQPSCSASTYTHLPRYTECCKIACQYFGETFLASRG